MEFRLLGRVEVVANGRTVPISGIKPRQLLTALVLNANALVSVERLVDALWPHNPPRSVLENLRTYAAVIRAAIKTAGPGAALRTSRAGYELNTPPASVDVEVFNSVVAEARIDVGAGQIDRAAARLSQALALWRGPAGEGLPAEGWLGAALESLNQLRLIATEDRADAWLQLGRHVEVIPELVRMTSDHPLRERLWRLLMLAQYRSGATQAALATYEQARRLLRDELGVEPGSELADMHRAILRRDLALAPPQRAAAESDAAGTAAAESTAAGQRAVRDGGSAREDGHHRLSGGPARRAVPRQMPTPPAIFVGHEDTLAAVNQALAYGSELGPAVVLITGPPGVGKSALATVAAHRARDRFPDGQLYVDLRDRGALADGGEALAALRQLLRALGDDTPARTAAEASGLLRSALIDRRVLIVIDNAIQSSTVEYLLPAGPGSAAIVTSIRTLGNNGISHRFPIGPLSDTAAMSLLEQIVGAGAVCAEPAAAADLVALCRGEPLVIKAVASRLAQHRSWSIRKLYDHLRVAGGLHEVPLGDTSLGDAMLTAVAELSMVRPGAANLLPRLASFTGVFDHTAVCDLLSRAGAEPVEQRPGLRDLDALIDFHLIETPAPGSFRLSELVRSFAAELQPDPGGESDHVHFGYSGGAIIPMQVRPRVRAQSLGLKEHHGSSDGTAG